MMDDWGALIGATVGILTAIGGAFAAWEKWGKSKAENKSNAASLTLDGVFKLVEQLQEETARKTEELISVDEKCLARIAMMEARIVVYEQTIARQVEVIADLRQHERELLAENAVLRSERKD